MDRKRPSADATAGSDRPDRKRRFSPPASSHASASNNGVSQMPGEEEEGEVDSLTAVVETFRKEAIYRQMLEYKRLHKRSSARVAELERRKHALEAGLEGVEVCWSELLATVRSLVGAKDLPDVSDPSRGTYPSSSSDLPKLSSEIDRRSQSTKQLLLKFVELAERGARASSEELRERYGTEHKKSATLRSSVNLLQSQLDLAREQQEKTQADLIRAEKKFDRLRCQTVQNVEDQQGTVPKKIPTNDMAVKAEPSPTPVSNGHSNAPTPDPPTTAPTGPPIIVPDPETALLASSRLDEINKLREDRVRLETTLDALRTQVEHPSESVIAQSELFKQLLAQVSFFKAEASQAKAHFEKLAAEVDSLRDGRQDFEDSAINESRQEVDRLREQLGRKEADLARLRGQRDDLHGELGEAQAGSRDSLKYTIELVALSESKQERIASLVSEVGRLKTKLAASAGSESLLEFLLTEAGSDASVSNITSYIKSLETKLESSEAQIASLAAQIAGFTSDASLSKALEGEAMARQALADVEVKLASYERVFGPNASGEMAELAKKLEEKTKEVKRLELMVKENDSATDALYSEVERLSKAWEDVAARVESKVFHLRDAEEKVARLATEKAKADNKYFAAMRTKEAVDLERKTALRNVEKQVKVLEKLAESERSLTSQLALQEKEMTVLKTHVRNYQTKIQDLEREAAALQITRDSNRKQIAEMTKSVASRTQIAEKERANSMALSEELEATKRELAKVRSRADAVSGGGGGGGTVKEGELQEERNKLYSILRCSTCQLRLRTHCITVCMHTFCKECIDARVQTRQRKCPACNIGFAVSQVQQIYFQ